MLPGHPSTPQGRWAWLAGRGAATGLVAMIAGFVVSHFAIPKAVAESKDLGAAPAVLAWLTDLGPMLPLLGVPALVLGILAFALRSHRAMLAALATLAGALAVLAIVGALLGALVPMYRMHSSLLR